MTHGTENTYQTGCRCRRCRRAHSAYNKPRTAARMAALRALSRQHPVEFRELYEAELVARGIVVRPRGRPRLEEEPAA